MWPKQNGTNVNAMLFPADLEGLEMRMKLFLGIGHGHGHGHGHGRDDDNADGNKD